VTDNDTKTASDEGSLFFSPSPSFARIPQGTTIRIIAARSGNHDPQPDDLNARDRRIVLYIDNHNLDASTDPGFRLGVVDNLVLLAPGPTVAPDDDRGIAFFANTPAITPTSFGVLGDGLLPNTASSLTN
jgi:hypothetical protein